MEHCVAHGFIEIVEYMASMSVIAVVAVNLRDVSDYTTNAAPGDDRTPAHSTHGICWLGQARQQADKSISVVYALVL